MDIEQTDKETAPTNGPERGKSEIVMEKAGRYLPWLFPVSATVIGAALTLTTLGPWFKDFGINEAVGWGIAGLYDLFWLGSLYYERDAINSAKKEEAELYRNFGWGFAAVATLLLIVHTIIKHPGTNFGDYIEVGLPGYIAGLTPVLAKVMWMFVSIRFDNWIPAETKYQIRVTRLEARKATALEVATWRAEAAKYMETERVQVEAKKNVAALQLELAADASQASSNVKTVREILGGDFAEEDLFQLPTELRPVPLPQIPVMMSRPARKQISAEKQTPRDVVSAPLSTNETKAWAWRELIKLYHKLNDQLPVEQRPMERQYFYTNLDTLDEHGKLIGFAQYLPEGVRDVLPTVITAGTFSKNFAKYPPSSFDDDESED